MKYIIAWPRILLVTLCMFLYVLVYILSRLLFGKSVGRALKMRMSCVKVMNWIMGIKIKVHGPIHKHNPALLVANHRCFADPLMALQYFYFYPIGKAEIADYPLIGTAAKETGVLFVQRDNKDSRNGVKEGIRDALLNKINIFLCPEGTINVAQTTKEMKKGSFDIAAELQVPVIPIALVYNNPKRDFWLPHDSLLTHIIKQIGKWRTVVDMYVPDKPFSNVNSIQLMNDCRNWIDEKLLLVKVPEEVAKLAEYTLKV